MKTFQHKITGVAIAFGWSFCIVASAQAETVEITNVVYSYSNSGGHGQDGQDGADGHDGRSGSDGQTVITGSGSAAVSVKTVIDGEKVLDWRTDNEAEASIGSTTATTTLSMEERSRLNDLLQKIQFILTNYVFNIL